MGRLEIVLVCNGRGGGGGGGGGDALLLVMYFTNRWMLNVSEE